MHLNAFLAPLLCLNIVSRALPTSKADSVSQQADADDAVAYAWVVGPTKQVKRTPEDADDAVGYALVVGPTSKSRRAAEDADDAVAYAWVVGPPAA